MRFTLVQAGLKTRLKLEIQLNLDSGRFPGQVAGRQLST